MSAEPLPVEEPLADDEPLADVPEAAPVSSTERVFHGRVWDVRRDHVDYGGHDLVREYMDHSGAVAVLVLDDDDRMLLIRQYRHPVRTREWEIPAGLLDVPGEDPFAAAQRELAEEADLAATEWAVLTDFFTTPGGSDESIRIYLARGLSTTPAFARGEEEADIETRWVPLDDVVDAILDRRLHNPSLLIGAFAAHLARSRGWSGLAAPDAEWPTRSHPIGSAGDSAGA